MIQFILNERAIKTDLPPGMAILDFIRYQQHLSGTKIGCREGDCGACTILVGSIRNGEVYYESVTSCLMPLGNARGKHIVTVEGINQPQELTPVQRAIAEEGGTQCGFCTPGFVMSLTGFCLQLPSEKSNAVAAMDGNICRCTGYKSLERAAARIEQLMTGATGHPLKTAMAHDIIPSYFANIKDRLQKIEIPETENGQLIVGGGTDLYVQRHDSMTGAAINFAAADPATRLITEENGSCVISGTATVTDLKYSPLVNKCIPGFHQYAKLVSSTPIRNMATVAGNFINASPIGDLTIMFLALNADIELSYRGKTRILPLRKLYAGYKKLNTQPGEMINRIIFPIPTADSFFHFEKVSKRTHLDIASVNTAIGCRYKEDTIIAASLSAGGVGPIPLYLEKSSGFLSGKKIDEQTIAGCIAVIKTEISPISDARGSKEYKTLLLEKLFRAHLMELNEMQTTE